MPLIPYPDVPPLPGVPKLNASSAGYVAAALTVVGELLPANLFGPQWAILDQKTGQRLLQPDSFVAIEYREEHKIPNYPIEQGSFQSYNKVALPYDIKLTVSCGGNGAMTIPQFLTAIDSMLQNLTIVSITAPPDSFPLTSLVHVDYRRESRQGVTLILAQLWFQELRIPPDLAGPPAAAASGAEAISNGQVSPVTPAPAVQSNIIGQKSGIDFGPSSSFNSWD